MLSGQTPQARQYLNLCKTMQGQEPARGREGMLQHRFVNEADAIRLVEWLKQQTNLQSIDIGKANARQEVQPDESILYVVRLTQKQREAILTLQTTDEMLLEVDPATNETGLFIAAKTKNEQEFIELVNKASVVAIDAALAKEANDGWTALHQAARVQNERAFMALLNKASVHAVDAALVKQTYNGWTVLHVVARYQNEQAFMALLYKASVAAIDAALVMKTKDGGTALKIAVYYQCEQGFITLLQKASAEALCRALAQKPEFILKGIFASQSPKVVAMFLQKLDQDELKKIISSIKLSHHILKKCASYLIHESSWRHPDFIKKCFAIMPEKLVTELLESWKEGVILSEEVERCMKELLVARDKGSLTGLEKDWLQYVDDRYVQKKLAVQLVDALFPMSKEELCSYKNYIAQWVFESGVTSWKDYHLLRLLQADIPGLKEVLDALKSADMLFTGCKVAQLPLSANDAAFDCLLKCAADGKVLFKMIQEKDWVEFFGQLEDYNTRPATLRKPDVKKDATHKFRHMKGMVEEYKKKDPSQPKPAHTHTKKLSTTLLAKSLCTTVFGEVHDDRELVGLMFDSSKCDIKALLAHDSGTFKHEWLGDKTDAQVYAERMKGINYTEKDKFDERVNKYPYRTNEVLAKLCREAMLAIVIARDTHKARSIARARQKEIQDKLKINLPIVFYDSVKRKIELYTPQQIRQDELGTNHCKEVMAKDRLMKLKSMIGHKSEWRVFSFFSLFSCFPADPNSGIMPKTARLILEEINKAEEADGTEEHSWEKKEKKIKEMLEKVNANSSVFRFKDTEEFYKDAYKQVFKPLSS